MLINMNQLLEIAKENHFAVGAFNVADSNFLRVVIELLKKTMHQRLSQSIRQN